MPEYSSTTITPSDGVQVPGMNGSTSGNFLLSALKSYILASKGQANGLASLDANGKLPSSQLPDLADDVIVVASYASLPATGTAGKIYITADNNKMYRWDPDLTTPDYVELSVDLSAYATKAELAAEESARESADTDLKDAIDFNRKRIENLEQKSGSVVDVDYPDYSPYGEVPTGKAKNAIVSKLRGVTVAYNQLAPSLKTGYSRFNLSETSKPNSTLFTVTGSGLGELYTSINFTAGHKVLVIINVLEKSSNTISFRVRRPFISGFNSSSELIGNIGIVSDSSDKNTLALQCDNTSEDDTFELDDAIISYDLTQMFGSQVADYIYSIEQATTGAGVALFKALVSAQDNSHETGRLVSTTYSAVNSNGFNLFDRTQAVADERFSSTGTTTASWTSRSDYIKVNPNTDYYFKNVHGGSTMSAVYWFDADKNYISNDALGLSSPQSGIRTSPSNAWYVGINFATSQTEVCVNVSQPNTGIEPHDGQYLPFIGNSMSLPTSVTLRGILKVVNNNLVVDGDEYEPETGEIERRYAEYALNGGASESVTMIENGGTYHRFLVSGIPNVKNAITTDIICSHGLIANTDCIYNGGNIDSYGAWIAIVNGHIRISVPYTSEADFRQWLNDQYTAGTPVTISYKVNTPTADTPLDPVLDPTIATEGGGTLSTEQTNDPAIVSALEMTYLTL